MDRQRAGDRREGLTLGSSPPTLTILGAGPAGLATGYFARKHALPFLILEAGAKVGGNAVTFQEGEFRFDSGAHRFHDQDPEMTREVRSLLGEDLLECALPSRIFHRGLWIDFPLSPLGLWRTLGPRTCGKAVRDLVRARLTPPDPQPSFEAFALRAYGREIAERFLLGYSEKLWGLPCRRLSPGISGKRLQGLSLGAFLLEAVGAPRAGIRHLDGRFYYPRHGFGTIAERLAEACGRERIRLGARITRMMHDGARIHGVEVNGAERLAVDQVVSTLPLPLLLRLLDPPVAPRLLEAAASLRFRHVLLVGIFLDRPSVTRFGSVYFPDPGFPMTRVCEPKNRSRAMAPETRTMLAVEVPCASGDPLWTAPEAEITAVVGRALEAVRWYAPAEVLGSVVKRLPAAYPVLELGADERVRGIIEALRCFRNLEVVGRNGLFRYNHTHQMLRFGQQAVARLLAPRLTRGVGAPSA